jgi:putative transposase
MNYRRLRLQGQCYFFTVVTHNRRVFFEQSEHIELLRQALKHVKTNHPFRMIAYVWMPDHIHCMWWLPQNDDDFPMRWRLIKHFMTRRSQAKQPIWQKRYWEHWIRNEVDYNRHMDYIHINPVKHGYVTEPEAWGYSSYQYYLEKGVYQHGWGHTAVKIDGDFGE